MGVKGFPTLKTVRPTGKKGKPIIQDYQGPREAKGIIEAVKGLIPNEVERVTDKDLDDWLQKSNETAKAILFTDKGTISALLKVLAKEYFSRLPIAQIRDKDKNAVSTFGIDTFPTLLVLPGGSEPAVAYEGEMKKADMKAFLDKYAAPAPAEPAPDSKQKPLKENKKATSSKSSSDKSTFSEASSSHATEEASASAATASTITLEAPSGATESPDPIATPEDAAAPIILEDLPPPLPTLDSEDTLIAQCLGPKTSNCVLALLPNSATIEAVLPESATQALSSLAELADKHKQRGGKIFPFYSVPPSNVGNARLREALGLEGGNEIQLIIVNGRRSWWQSFSGSGYGSMQVESWIDNIRFGEGKKEKLPEGLVRELESETTTTEEAEPVEIPVVAEEPATEEPQVAEDEAPPAEPAHAEL